MKLQRVVDKDDKPVGWIHECPGCGNGHCVYVEQPNPVTGASWQFDGNMEQPTFSPSVLCFHWSEYDSNGKQAPGATKITDCHYHLRGGQIEFCGDSRHALAGKTVPLPEIDR